MMEEILIIPDVHGRTFWKEAVAARDYDSIVFLGDYVDPYPQEGINTEMAYNGLYDILDLKRADPERVVLLWGNHDLHYFSDYFRQYAMGSRFDAEYADTFHYLFETYQDYFQLAFEATIGSKRYLLTHAGVVPVWYEECKDLIGELTAENLNTLLGSYHGMRSLMHVGAVRNGVWPVGSPVWADVYELMASEPLDGIYQIFGHTRQRPGHPQITDHWACIDCMGPFILDSRGLFIVK